MDQKIDIKKYMAVKKACEDMANNGIIIPTPIGYLEHKPTLTHITVYKPISRFKAFMLRWCFGLKYKKYDN